MPKQGTAKGEYTKAEICQAALRLFRENGYHGTSMRAIARNVGMAVGGIYNHFSSKEEIFQSVLLEFHPYKDVVPALSEARGDTLEEFVRDAAGRMVEGIGKPLDFLNLIFIELVEFNGKHIPELFQLIYPQLVDFGQRFQRDSQQLRSIPLSVLLRSFIGLFFSYVMTGLILSDQMPADMQDHAFDDFVDIYLHGILRDGSVSESN
jgi:AcrR family transcriptional regulator